MVFSSLVQGKQPSFDGVAKGGMLRGSNHRGMAAGRRILHCSLRLIDTIALPYFALETGSFFAPYQEMGDVSQRLATCLRTPPLPNTLLRDFSIRQ